MAQNVEKNIASIYDNLEYNYDKVRFISGNPPLAGELNLAQELQEIITQKSTAHLPSGWLSYRPYYTSNSLQNSFYTQEPNSPKPEVALVNGWPIYVTNTNTSLKHMNKISLNDFELKSGSRVDGIFLEVWRSAIGPEDAETGTVSKPQNVSQISTLYSVEMYDEDLGWAVGEKGTILKTVDGGVSWISKEAPVSVKYTRIKFYNKMIGYGVAEKGYVIKTVNGGESWYELTTPVNDNLNDLSILDQNTVVVVGDNGTVLRTIDGSEFELNKNTDGITDNLNGVHFYDNRIGWAVGDSGALILTKNKGVTWESHPITEARTQQRVTQNLKSVAFFNMDDGLVAGNSGTILKTADGGYTWTSVADRIWDGSQYTTLSALHPNESNNLNRIETRRDFPHNYTIGIYSSSQQYFENILYRISPSDYPGSLVLEWSGKLDGQDYKQVLNLNNYATADALADAVNAILSPYSPSDVALSDDDRAKVRVFQMTVHYADASKPSDFRPSSGSIPTTGSTEITFSIEDKAWIVGNDGLVLQSNNSGSKWEEIDNSYGFDLYDAYFEKNNLGWISGSSGSLIKYSAGSFSLQDTDLSLKTKGRIYPEGNILSETEDYLQDTIIDPKVGVKTTERVQIQYRIRVIDGIDPFNYQEAGLGATYIHSLGPNQTLLEAGQYSYENMGTENGDYGLWRARCRNTYDGYTWAIPMFLVTRRNSSPFNADTNINGSTDYNLSAIRPDRLTYEQIADEDIVDIRKKINIHSYSYLIEKNFDKLMGNRLKTKVSARDERGTQYGASILLADVYSGQSDIESLIRGNVTSEVDIVEETKTLDPNADTPLSDDDWTLGPSINSIYMADPAYHTVVSVTTEGSSETETSKIIPGSFEGLGTDTIKFNIDEYTPASNEKYRIKANRMYYGDMGLTHVPNEPLGIKYIPDTEDNAFFYHGINSNRDSGVQLEKLAERVSGYQDYVTVYPGVKIGDQEEDKNLYKNKDNYTDNSTVQKRSFLKFEGQQFRGSLTEYTYFMKTTAVTTQLKIPKDLNGYGVLNVKKVQNANDDTEYFLSTDYEDKPALMTSIKKDDGTYNVNNVIINLASTYAIPENTVIKIILEVTSTGETGQQSSELNLSVSNVGQTQEAYRNPFSCNFNVGSKGIEGFYKPSLYRIEQLGGNSRIITVDLTQPGSEYSDLENGTILGLGTFRTPSKNYQSFVWYRSSEETLEDQNYPYHAIPVSYTQNLGTSTVTIYLDSEAPMINGVVYIPILVKQYTLSNLTDDSTSYTFYKYRPFQTVESLPNTLTCEIVNMPDFVFVSNLGTGGSNEIKKDPYENPIEHIPVNDTELANDNIFSNVDDLDFTNFSVDTGLVKLPALISRKIGEDITLSSPNNIGDRLGRTFYEKCSEDFRFQAENLLHPVPRKVFIPVLARIRSDLTKPFIRGEIVLLVISKVFKARIENEVGFFDDENTEYEPGYFEESDTAIGVYRLLNNPTVRM